MQTKETATGDCFEAAAKWIIDNGLGPFADHCILVHAEVAGQGELAGQTLGHAWVENEETGFAIDVSNGREIYLPTWIYRAVGQVDVIGNEYRYTAAEAARYVLGEESWGPWDLETEQ